MQSFSLLVFTAAALALTGSLRAQTPGGDPAATPVLGPATTAAPTPTATEPDSMTKAVKPAKERTLPKAVLEKYDTNKNGVLDPEERAKYESDRPLRKAEKMKKYDKNGDGKLDEDEKIQMRVERLREADAARKAAKEAPAKQ